MWKSVKLHFSVNTKILEFLKVQHFFHGFRIQFCFQILSLQINVLAKMKVIFFFFFFWGGGGVKM